MLAHSLPPITNTAGNIYILNIFELFYQPKSPSVHLFYLLLHFQEDLVIEDHWRVNGRHYEKTLLAWLDLMDRARSTVMPVMEQVYGAGEALKWFVRWRVFMLACAGLFGYRHGEEWFVSHYLFRAR